MFTETLQRERRCRQFVADFPLEPIEDENSYQRAIEILDRLFHLRREKDREEIEYFKAIAQMAYEYECSAM